MLTDTINNGDDKKMYRVIILTVQMMKEKLKALQSHE